jgi:DNA-directed RNA polymerase subunit L
MAVDVDHPQDSDLISETNIDIDDEAAPKLTGKEASQHTLEMRRKLEDRLERKRLKDQLGFDDISDLDF